MRNKEVTKNYYINQLGFQIYGNDNVDEYLMIHKDHIQIHFFEFKDLDPLSNDGQVYIRTNDIDSLYKDLLDKQIPIPPNGHLQTKPWGQREFSLLDPDHNLLTFGQSLS